MNSKMYPCLWFNGNAKQAALFYSSIFSDFTIISENSMVIIFELNGNRFMGLNGGPQFQFTEAVSFVIECETQHEIDFYWEKLLDGGKESRCGWLKDQFGLSWQIIPSRLGKWMSNPETASSVGAELMKMIKIDISILENALKPNN